MLQLSFQILLTSLNHQHFTLLLTALVMSQFCLRLFNILQIIEVNVLLPHNASFSNPTVRGHCHLSAVGQDVLP